MLPEMQSEMQTAVLDACVLYPVHLRDFLLHLGSQGEIIPFWSEEIQNEWTRNLLLNRPDIKRESLERTRRRMAFHFPKGQVQGYESITSTLWLPDPNDRHVLAVAIHTKAKYIVTFDLNHFPNAVLQPHNIEAVSPDELVMRLIQKRPVHILDVVKTHRLSLTRPPKTVDEYLATLEEQGLAKTVAFLREYRSDI